MPISLPPISEFRVPDLNLGDATAPDEEIKCPVSGIQTSQTISQFALGSGKCRENFKQVKDLYPKLLGRQSRVGFRGEA